MLWYMIKTWAGKEKELEKEIRRTVPPYMYEEVFIIYAERVWRRQGKSVIHSEPLFPGCVFLTCHETTSLFQRLERIPAMSKWMDLGSLTMFPLQESDAQFLNQMSGENHTIKFSYVLREKGKTVYHVSGPLELCLERIEGFEFRKRYVKICKKLWGEEKQISLGIILNEDIEPKRIFEGSELSAEDMEEYTELKIEKDAYIRGLHIVNYPMENVCAYESIPKVG